MDKPHHFILVHGLNHGAWCWYKLLPLLKSSGHKATAIDLGGCGTDSRGVRDVRTLDAYFGPLMDLMSSLPDDEKVVLVGHSYGGLGVALAMEKFPNTVLVAIFVCAYMPNITSPIALLEESFRRTPVEQFMDSIFEYDDGPENPPTSVNVGPELMSKRIYHDCSLEDLELAKLLVRATGIFNEEIAKGCLLTEERYGSVDRVFVIAKEDRVMEEEFQKWIIERTPPKEVKSIEGVGHMVMLSKPKELSLCLLEIASQHPSINIA